VRLALLLLAALPAWGQPTDTLSAPALGGTLTAAVHHAPPFAIRHADGTWDGAAVELWRALGRAHGFDAQLMPVETEAQVVGALGRGADVALTVTVNRADLDRADFLPSYYAPRLGIAEPRDGQLVTVLKNLFNPTFGRIVLGLSILMLVVGVIVWLLERRENDDEFRSGLPGIWDGFWWAGVTMTTIGYGDKAPRSVAGRVSALLWMLVSMAVTASLTAALVSALGLGGGGGGGSAQLSDLAEQRVGVVGGSYAAGVLRAEAIEARAFGSVEEALRAVRSDSVDALVGAAPVVREAASALGMTGDVRVREIESAGEQWALAVPQGSALREPLGRALVGYTESPGWRATLRRYLPSGGS
jgi:ABC-type amino acid transport substrate-binding protein